MLKENHLGIITNEECQDVDTKDVTKEVAEKVYLLLYLLFFFFTILNCFFSLIFSSGMKPKKITYLPVQLLMTVRNLMLIIW